VRGNPGFDLGPKRVLIAHQPGRVINTGQYLLTTDCEPLLARLGYRARVEVLALTLALPTELIPGNREGAILVALPARVLLRLEHPPNCGRENQHLTKQVPATT
jgi:hypothetical protein